MKDKQIPTLHPSLSKLMHKVYANPELFTSEAYQRQYTDIINQLREQAEVENSSVDNEIDYLYTYAFHILAEIDKEIDTINDLLESQKE